MRILLVGGWEENYKRALAFGLEVVGFIPERSRSLLTATTIVQCKLYDIEINDVCRCIYLALKLHRKEPFSGVFSFTELGLETAGLIASILALPGSSFDANVVTRNKDILRQSLRGTILDNVAFRVANSHQDIDEFASSAGYPFIGKPVAGQGSIGIRFFTAGTDCNNPNEQWPLLLEKFVEGPEYSVEAVSLDGVHHILAATEKATNRRFVETQHVFPALLNDEEQTTLVEATKFLLDRLALMNGVSHSEFKLGKTASGELVPYLIETQLRPGGDRIWKLVEICYGIKLDELIIAQALQMHVPVDLTRRRVASSFFPQFEEGILADYSGVEAVSRSPGVESFEFRYSIGDRVVEFSCSADRKCCLVVSGRDHSEVQTNMAGALSKLVVVIEQ
ncbi:MAG: ATP-grasp domain-containing protein [Beijerinckiaceae bacterium]|nr:ATP-grasp domain-containing protein [Beijerinckiaceae bacterium]